MAVSPYLPRTWIWRRRLSAFSRILLDDAKQLLKNSFGVVQNNALNRGKKLMKRWFIYLSMMLLLFCGLFRNSSLFAAEPDELEGILLIAPNDCYQHEHQHKGPKEDYYISNEDTSIDTEIDLSEVDKRGLRANDFIKIKGNFRNKGKKGGLRNFNKNAFKVRSLTKVNRKKPSQRQAITKKTISQGSSVEPIGADAEAIEMRNIMIVLGSSNDNPCITTEAQARGLLFDNPNNANMAYQKASFGKYGLMLGMPGKESEGVQYVHLDTNTVGLSRLDVAAMMTVQLNTLESVFTDFHSVGGSYGRVGTVIYFMPTGTGGWVGVATYDHWKLLLNRVEDANGDRFLDLVVHEMGHNMDMRHSGIDPENDDTINHAYADKSCVMGYSSGDGKCPNFNAPKKYLLGWVPDSTVEVTSDGGTYDLYAQDIDPAGLPGTRTLHFAKEDTEDIYFVSFRTYSSPYSHFPSDYDKRISIHRLGSYGSSDQMPIKHPSAIITTLVAGETWTDSVNGISVTCTGIQGGDYGTVSITFGPHGTLFIFL
jgi:hypothetical protein